MKNEAIKEILTEAVTDIKWIKDKQTTELTEIKNQLGEINGTVHKDNNRLTAIETTCKERENHCGEAFKSLDAAIRNNKRSRRVLIGKDVAIIASIIYLVIALARNIS